MAFRMSEDAILTPISVLNAVADQELGLLSVRNNNASTPWLSMAEFDRVFAQVICSETWNAADPVTTLKLQQATDASGTGVKDITSSASGGNYNTDNDKLTAEDSFAILECRAEDMDQNNGFLFVRLYAASTGNTATDNLFGVLIRYNAVHRKKQLAGAYVAATAVYVTPQGASS